MAGKKRPDYTFEARVLKEPLGPTLLEFATHTLSTRHRTPTILREFGQANVGYVISHTHRESRVLRRVLQPPSRCARYRTSVAEAVALA